MNCFGTHSTTSSYGLVGYDAALTRLRSLVRFRVVVFLFALPFCPNEAQAYDELVAMIGHFYLAALRSLKGAAAAG
ncbi:hypothetical protein THAOC_23092 [Thalassiosira oceanica]|uniref:Uncharacterized protein n=1 Tax=Thalassiosira oceanica TaxID=159749 RepID=K0RV78_THAOC|nr:hypothetical protein THAOC_23092 [Thalassiosira oceanica]|eukprot:EJK56925.1 hypothetical protein THAOC_23092 [Thalassiosira oceanica]